MQLRAETTARRLKTRALRQNFQTFKSILNSGALFFFRVNSLSSLTNQANIDDFHIFINISAGIYSSVLSFHFTD